jgi:hypothetical protein
VEIVIYNTSTKRSLNLASFSKSGYGGCSGRYLLNSEEIKNKLKEK